MPRGFIFDMDGVLVDSEPLVDEFAAALAERLKPGSSIDFEKLRGMNAVSFYSFFIKELKLDMTLEELMAMAQPIYISFFESKEGLAPIPGVAELIQKLKKLGIALAVASSASRERVDLFIERLGFSDSFPVRVGGDEIRNGKPDPEIFILAAERIRIPPSHCLVIEDSTSGVAAAKAAGMRCIGYAGLPHNRQDLSRADIIIKDFSEVTNEVLEQLYA